MNADHEYTFSDGETTWWIVAEGRHNDHGQWRWGARIGQEPDHNLLYETHDWNNEYEAVADAIALIMGKE